MDWLRHIKGQPQLNSGALRHDITMNEVCQHNKAEDAWIVFNQQVYDITQYLKFHPGGSTILTRYAGSNTTTAFMRQHPYVNIRSILQTCLVGTLAKSPIQAKAEAEVLALREGNKDNGDRGALPPPITDSIQGLGDSAITRKNPLVLEIESPSRHPR